MPSANLGGNQTASASLFTYESLDREERAVRYADEFADYAAASQQRFYRHAYLLCGDSDQARDLVQSTLLQLYRRWPRVRAARSIDAYAHKTLVRSFLDGRRKANRERAIRQRLGPPAPPLDSTPLRLTMLEALAQLPPRARAIVVLRYWEDLSVEQTADVMGCSAGNVKAQSSRALHSLRERLGTTFTDLIDT